MQLSVLVTRRHSRMILTRVFISPLCSGLARCVQACTLPAVHPEAGKAQWAVFQVPLLSGMCADGCTGVHHTLLSIKSPSHQIEVRVDSTKQVFF